MPKFKAQPSFQTSDIYLQKIVELYPELQDAVFIDSVQYDLYNVNHVEKSYIHSILNNIPVVGFYNSNDHVFRNKHTYHLYYEFYNINTETLYRFIFEKEIAEKNSADVDKKDKPYNLTKINISNLQRMNVNKKIIEKDTLVELSNKDRDRYYTLKKEDHSITRLIQFDYTNFNKALNEIRFASSNTISGDDFSVDIVKKYNSNLGLFIPVYDGKTSELEIKFRDSIFKTTAVVSAVFVNDVSNLSEICNPDLYNPRVTCRFELTAPFENCNLKLDVEYKDDTPIVYIKNDIVQLMQCLNIW
jgi:hypothetical protein